MALQVILNFPQLLCILCMMKLTLFFFVIYFRARKTKSHLKVRTILSCFVVLNSYLILVMQCIEVTCFHVSILTSVRGIYLLQVYICSSKSRVMSR